MSTTATTGHTDALDDLSHCAYIDEPLPGGRRRLVFPGVADAESVEVRFDQNDEEPTTINGLDSWGWSLYSLTVTASTPVAVVIATINSCAGLDD